MNTPTSTTIRDRAGDFIEVDHSIDFDGGPIVYVTFTSQDGERELDMALDEDMRKALRRALKRPSR